jgi:hypothetical protein
MIDLAELSSRCVTRICGDTQYKSSPLTTTMQLTINIVIRQLAIIDIVISGKEVWHTAAHLASGHSKNVN